jgi:high-affinity iron transporter
MSVVSNSYQAKCAWRIILCSVRRRDIIDRSGLAAQAVHFLERADWLRSLDTVVWDSGWLLSESSIPGRALHTLIGYADQPTQTQLLVYLAVIAITGLLMLLTAQVRGGNAVAAG